MQTIYVGFITRELDRLLKEYNSVTEAWSRMQTGLCVLSCCVEPYTYSEYYREAEKWKMEHESL